jgi:hypothetical protein
MCVGSGNQGDRDAVGCAASRRALRRIGEPRGRRGAADRPGRQPRRVRVEVVLRLDPGGGAERRGLVPLGDGIRLGGVRRLLLDRTLAGGARHLPVHRKGGDLVHDHRARPGHRDGVGGRTRGRNLRPVLREPATPRRPLDRRPVLGLSPPRDRREGHQAIRLARHLRHRRRVHGRRSPRRDAGCGMEMEDRRRAVRVRRSLRDEQPARGERVLHVPRAGRGLGDVHLAGSGQRTSVRRRRPARHTTTTPRASATASCGACAT